jgi:hypothetical protein
MPPGGPPIPTSTRGDKGNGGPEVFRTACAVVSPSVSPVRGALDCGASSGRSSWLFRLSNALEARNEFGQVLDYGLPEDIQVNVEMGVHQPVPHGDDLGPRNTRVLRPEVWRKADRPFKRQPVLWQRSRVGSNVITRSCKRASATIEQDPSSERYWEIATRQLRPARSFFPGGEWTGCAMEAT